MYSVYIFTYISLYLVTEICEVTLIFIFNILLVYLTYIFNNVYKKAEKVKAL